MSFFDLLDWAEPRYLIGVTVAAWIVTFILWMISPELVPVALIIAILLSIFTVVFLFVPISESGSAAKVDKMTGKQRCRVCHQYFDELLDGICYNCNQQVEN